MAGIVIINISLILFVVVLFLYKKFNWIMPFLALVIGVFTFSLTLSIDYRHNEDIRKSVEKETLTELNGLRSRLEMGINRNTVLIHGLSAFVSINPHMTQERFDEFASSLMQYQSHILNFGGAPDLVLKFIYPLKGNEKALGLRYEEIPEQKKAAMEAVNLRKIIVAGPVDLIQGGQAFIGRVATYTKDEKGNEVLWGLVSAPISVDKLYADAGVSEFQEHYRLSIRGKDGKGEKGDVFLGSAKLFQEDFLQQEVFLPHGSWVIAAAPNKPWSFYNRPNYAYWVIDWAFYGLLAFLIYLNAQTFILKQTSAEKLHESEELLRVMFENSPVGIALFDAKYMHTKMNKAYEQIFGYSAEDILNKKLSFFNSAELMDLEQLEISKLDSQSQMGPYLKSIRRKDGTNRFLNVAGVQLITKKGEKVLWVFAEDITKEKLNEMKILTERENALFAKQEAEIAAKSKSVFLATMSHEIRTPINGIMASADLLEREKLSAEQQEYVDIISRSSGFLLNIINDILDLAKLRHPDLEL